VYLGKKTEGPEMAVKVFGNGSEDMCQIELVTLNLFKSAGRQNVPIVQEELRNGKFPVFSYLAVLPIGIRSGSQCSLPLISSLSECLSRFWQLSNLPINNIIHRPENILLDQDHSKIVLND
jgi:hypothetical protein